MKLTDNQVLSVLNLNEMFPGLVWFSEVHGSTTEWEGKRITVHAQSNASQNETEEAIKTIFPDASFNQFSTCEWIYDIRWQGESIGALCMTKEPSTAMEGEKDTQHKFITRDEYLELHENREELQMEAQP